MSVMLHLERAVVGILGFVTNNKVGQNVFSMTRRNEYVTFGLGAVYLVTILEPLCDLTQIAV